MRPTLYRAISARLLNWAAWWDERADRHEPEPAEPEVEIPVLGAPPGTMSRIRRSDLDRAMEWQRAEATREREVHFTYLAGFDRPARWTVQ